MKKTLFLVVLPAILALSSCSTAPKTHVKDQMIEDTLVHEEIFGELPVDALSKKIDVKKSLSAGTALYKPALAFQRKDNTTAGTYSVRFVAAIQSAADTMTWTRSVHNLNGQIAEGKGKKDVEVNTVYTALNNGGVLDYARDVEAADGTKPYDAYAVYCLLNIPNEFSSYYVDAYLSISDSGNSDTSVVGSLNVADANKYLSYSLAGGNRYVAEINGVLRESDTLQDNNHLNVFGVSLDDNDTVRAYYFNTSNLTYTLYDYNAMGRTNPDFKVGTNNAITPKYANDYNIFLNENNNFFFEKKITFQAYDGWYEASAKPMIELKHTNTGSEGDQYKSYEMIATNTSTVQNAFVDISWYDNVQFFRNGSWGNSNHTGFMAFPTDGKDLYTRENNTSGYWSKLSDGLPIIENSNFVINEITDPVTIHTDAQATYLAYSGDYSTIDTNLYPDGKSHQSNSLPVTVTFNYNAPSGKSVSKYSIMFGKEADLSDGYTVDGTTTKSISFYNPYLGRNYYKLIAKFSDNSTEESAIHHFDVDTTYPRNLTIGGMTNCRDMGGRVLEDGGTFKQGLVYRTSGYKYDYSTTITDDGIKEMLQHLKVKTEVNVADGTGYNLNLSGTTVKDFKMDYSGGSHHFSRNTESVRMFFELLADSRNYPVFFHCRIGTDRTGLCAILLSGLMGVSLNEIYQDYLFSNFGKIGEKRYIGSAAGNDNIQNYINQILNLSGTTFKNKVYNALLSIGLSRQTLDAVISNLTEGTPAQGNDAGQVIARADVLTGSGVNASTTSNENRDHPNTYYVLDSTSKSVSYSFNVEEAYKGQIIAYLGNTDSSTSKFIDNAISCSIDNSNIGINHTSYSAAGMGQCKSKNESNTDYYRMNYYFVMLAEVDIAAGSHTIKITGTSNQMNVGGIYIFNAGSANSGSQGGDDPVHTSHTYVAQSPTTNKADKQVTTYLCSCGKKYIDIDFNDYSSINGSIENTGKIVNGTVLKWDFPAKAGSVDLQFAVKIGTSSNIDTTKYVFKVNGVQQTVSITNGVSYSSLGLSTSAFTYLTFCSFDIDNDMNVEIEFDSNVDGYRLIYGETVRLMYAQ